MELLGTVVMAFGVILMLVGVIGIFKFRGFYYRILVAPKIDAVGLFTVVIGVVIRHGLSFFSLRALLLLGLMLIVNPMVSYIIAHSAYKSGHRPEDKNDNSPE